MRRSLDGAGEKLRRTSRSHVVDQHDNARDDTTSSTGGSRWHRRVSFESAPCRVSVSMVSMERVDLRGYESRTSQAVVVSWNFTETRASLSALRCLPARARRERGVPR